MEARRVWQMAEVVLPSAELLDFLQGDALIAGMLVRRGIETPQQAALFLYPDNYPVTPPEELPDLAVARDRVIAAIDQNERIAIWGDFDVDGQTSTSLLVGALTALGNAPLYYIPHRKQDGHGIHLEALERFLGDHPVDLLITCDTGIQEHAAVAFANACGVAVIITDHHNLPDELPEALACVNPERVPPNHPLHDMTGVGAAYQLIKAVCRELGKPQIAEAQLDLVALGTVADVGKLRDENRYLVQRGLAVLRQGERLGLKTLLTVARASSGSVNTETIGFTIAPRMNAVGRLSNANQMVELLTTEQEGRAEQMAIFVDGLNAQRKAVQNRIRTEAFENLEAHPHWADYNVIVLHQRDWESGVVGIVANSIVERYGKPAILLTGETQDGYCFGSARSLEGVPLIDIINANQPLIEGQGHTMAAGARCKIEDLEQVRQALHQTTLEMLPEGLPPFVQPVEMEIALSDITQEFVDDLERLEPFGAGNPKPVFYTPNVQVHSSLIFGRDETHRKITVEDENGTRVTLTWWNSAEFDLPEGLFDIAYTVQNSTYRGVHSISILWVDARQSEAQHVIKEARPLQIIDLRDPRAAPSADVFTDAVIWREGAHAQTVKGVNRLELGHTPVLAIYSLPASLSVLQGLLETSQAEQLVLALQGEPQDDDPVALLNRLGQMVNYAVRHTEGWLPFGRVSAALNQRDAVILRGLELLEGLGQITILELHEEGAVVQLGGKRAPQAQLQQLNNNFTYQVQETASFRKFAAQAPVDWFRELAES